MGISGGVGEGGCCGAEDLRIEMKTLIFLTKAMYYQLKQKHIFFVLGVDPFF